MVTPEPANRIAGLFTAPLWPILTVSPSKNRHSTVPFLDLCGIRSKIHQGRRNLTRDGMDYLIALIG